jgi:AraC family transcriptional regulator
MSILLSRNDVSESPFDAPAHLEDASILRVLNEIERSRSVAWRLDDLARMVGLSPYQLHRRFKRLMGETIGDYVRRTRLDMAATLLCRGYTSILEAAIETGYGSQAAFTRAFSRQFGLSPAEARKAVLQQMPVPSADHRDFARATRPQWQQHVPLIAMRFHGAHADAPRHWRRFAVYLQCLGYDLSYAKAVGILYDDPGITPAHRFRYDCCIVDVGYPAHLIGAPLRRQSIRVTEFASLDVKGPYSVIAEAVFGICNVWMSQQRRAIGTSPAYEIHRSAPWAGGGFDTTLLVPLA